LGQKNEEKEKQSSLIDLIVGIKSPSLKKRELLQQGKTPLIERKNRKR